MAAISHAPGQRFGRAFDTRAHAALANLGSVPGDPSEVRAFVQRRVAIYFGVSFGCWLGGLVIDTAMGGLLYVLGPGGLIIRAATTALLGSLWLWTSRGERSVAVVQHIEVAATMVSLGSFVAVCAVLPATWRPNMLMLFGTAEGLALRAAIVPGRPRRVFIVGLLAHVPVLAGLLHVARVASRDGYPTSVPTLRVEMIGSAIWMLVTLAVTTSIAWVIYGLQRRVAAALKLGQYTLFDKLGQGGMGAVYRARHALLRRKTAVKVMRPSERAEATIARFEREVQLTSEISHPNIVSVYDFGRSPDGSFYYAMEYLDGIDLERLVAAEGPLPAGRVVHILEQVGEALAEAHAFGLVHRDIKPSNIVLCDQRRRPDHVKVVDFGLVKQLGMPDPRLSTSNAIVGTPLYFAPESISSPGEVDERTDLYAVGAVAYYLLTGEPVFHGSNPSEVCASVLRDAVEPPSSRLGRPVPAKLEALVLACLAKEKAGRPADAVAFLAALRACDDVAPWTVEDAHRWWAERGAAVQERGQGSLAFTSTLLVGARPEEGVSAA